MYLEFFLKRFGLCNWSYSLYDNYIKPFGEGFTSLQLVRNKRCRMGSVCLLNLKLSLEPIWTEMNYI